MRGRRLRDRRRLRQYGLRHYGLRRPRREIKVPVIRQYDRQRWWWSERIVDPRGVVRLRRAAKDMVGIVWGERIEVRRKVDRRAGRVGAEGRPAAGVLQERVSRRLDRMIAKWVVHEAISG